MGAGAFGQLRSDAVYEADRRSLTCVDACEQTLRTPACPVRDEEAAESNPLPDLGAVLTELAYHPQGRLVSPRSPEADRAPAQANLEPPGDGHEHPGSSSVTTSTVPLRSDKIDGFPPVHSSCAPPWTVDR
jgi:hypothetical protein